MAAVTMETIGRSRLQRPLQRGAEAEEKVSPPLSLGKERGLPMPYAMGGGTRQLW